MSASIPESIQTTIRTALAERLASFQTANGHHITVLLAVARGSHAWELDSPTSDYDVGIVYTFDDERAYAHLGDRQTAITDSWTGVGDADLTVDVHGWDVTTFAGLLADSNDQALEVLRSPIVYRDRFDRTALREYVHETYNPLALYHNYRSIAKRDYRTHLSHHLTDDTDTIYPIQETTASGDYRVTDPTTGDQRRIAATNDAFTETTTRQTVKRNLFVAKAALTAAYIRHTSAHGTPDLPAVSFPTFLTEQAPAVVDDDRLATVHRLVKAKRAGHGDRIVGDLIGRAFAHRPHDLDPDVHARPGPDPDRLNEFIDTMLAAAT